MNHKKLQEARVKEGYETATDAARAMGIPIQTYISHENGDRSPRLHSARRYADFFNVDYAWLLSEDDDVPTTKATTHSNSKAGDTGKAVGYDPELWEAAEKEARDIEEELENGGYMPSDRFTHLLKSTYKHMAIRRK
ncbi:helix-turn-helix transcriptional regulator [Roseibium sediminis]|uniref:helix-turn-helix transcriptional regulator n=1 Tax=Roseibium sediminis TaxID=1775174 RepID=UPI00123D4EAA|nr:helix-turn-helix transcriptional regulator [Roseibium sediminis]